MATKSRSPYHVKYNAEKYDRIGIRMPKGMKDEVFAFCEEHGESFNGMMARLIEEDMKRAK